MTVRRDSRKYVGLASVSYDDVEIINQPLLPQSTVLSEINRSMTTDGHQQLLRFFSAIGCCLCAGSLTTYSLYSNQFLSRLGYSQLQVNGLSISAELAMCLPVALYGYLCDRYSPRPLAFFSGLFFAIGYILAAFTYQLELHSAMLFTQSSKYWYMIAAFLAIGAATSCMYIAALTTCAKNFGESDNRGLLLAIPIAAFGLSGVWQSQLGLFLFREVSSHKSLDVFSYFLSLAALSFAAGLLGTIGLTTDASSRSSMHGDETERLRNHKRDDGVTYGTVSEGCPEAELGSFLKRRSFFRDPNMWLLALGFLSAIGVGEAYMNNVGTILTVSCPDSVQLDSGSASNHVSLLAITSTIARLLVGILSDMFAPKAPSLMSNVSRSSTLNISRIVFLLGAAVLLLLGFGLLCVPQLHRIESCKSDQVLYLTTALVGTGYGSTFTLVPVIITVIWGVQDFGTNWGFIATLSSLGVALWSFIYAWLYESATDGSGNVCTAGWNCYGPWAKACTFSICLAMAVWVVAWKRNGGWQHQKLFV